MKKIKLVVFIFLIFILVGCGAQVKYKTNVNTSQQSIKVNIELSINKDDYQYIKGGREKLISVINDKIPKDLNFSIDKNNKDLYLFDLSFSSYQEYQSKYKAITNQESKSVFQISEYTDDSPFKASQNIEIKDDMKYLLDWLKDALIDSGIISSEYKDKLISNQSSSYYFDDKVSYDQSYQGESVIDLTQNNINILIKKDNKIDFNLSFLISEDLGDKFNSHFETYVKSKSENVSLEKSSVKYNEMNCIQYDLDFKDLDISLENSLLEVNDILGDDFLVANSQNIDEKSFFYVTYNQDTHFVLNMEKLFELGKVSPGTIHIDTDGVDVKEDAEVPIDEPISLENSHYQYTLSTTYISIEYLTIIIMLIVIVIVLICIKKYSKNSGLKFKIGDVKVYYSQLENLIFHSLFESHIEVEDKQIVGDNFIISTMNIDKVDYGKSHDFLLDMKKLLLPVGGGIVFYFINMKWIAYIILIFIAIFVIIVIKINYQYNAIELELSSGKRYFFVLDENEKTKKVYQQLIDILDKTKDINEEFIKEIMKEKKETQDEED